MKTHFQKQVRKAYLSTAVGKMDKLFAEERRWKRKMTLAQNKLASARRRINDYAMNLAEDALERARVLESEFGPDKKGDV